jgi:hypothetical protein
VKDPLDVARKCIALSASDKPGEASAAALKACALIRENGFEIVAAKGAAKHTVKPSAPKYPDMPDMTDLNDSFARAAEWFRRAAEGDAKRAGERNKKATRGCYSCGGGDGTHATFCPESPYYNPFKPTEHYNVKPTPCEKCGGWSGAHSTGCPHAMGTRSGKCDVCGFYGGAHNVACGRGRSERYETDEPAIGDVLVAKCEECGFFQDYTVGDERMARQRTGSAMPNNGKNHRPECSKSDEWKRRRDLEEEERVRRQKVNMEEAERHVRDTTMPDLRQAYANSAPGICMLCGSINCHTLWCPHSAGNIGR